MTYSWKDVLVLATMIDFQISAWGHHQEHFVTYCLFLYKKDYTIFKMLSEMLFLFEDNVNPWQISDNWDDSKEAWDIIDAERKDLPLHMSAKEDASKLLLDWRFKILDKQAYKSFLGVWRNIIKEWEKEKPKTVRMHGQDHILTKENEIKLFKTFLEKLK